jgi:hypothetical protein
MDGWGLAGDGCASCPRRRNAVGSAGHRRPGAAALGRRQEAVRCLHLGRGCSTWPSSVCRPGLSTSGPVYVCVSSVSQHRSAKAIQTLCVCVIASRCRCVCVCDRVCVRVCVCAQGIHNVPAPLSVRDCVVLFSCRACLSVCTRVLGR